jgi:5-methylthioadenosine/S-adenosylhomocysteine deaminase
MTSIKLATIVTVAVAATALAQNAPRQVGMIVAGGAVVTVDGKRNIYNPGSVAIDGTNIVGVGSAADIAARFKAKEQIDAAGSIVIPGLINAHTHAPMVLYRGLADDLRLQEWLEKYIFPQRRRP